jgi:hypothetical protein
VVLGVLLGLDDESHRNVAKFGPIDPRLAGCGLNSKDTSLIQGNICCDLTGIVDVKGVKLFILWLLFFLVVNLGLAESSPIASAISCNRKPVRGSLEFMLAC